MDCFATLAITISSMAVHLLLLLLLAGIDHPPSRQGDRFAKHIEIADMIGKDQNQRRIEIGALLIAQSAMGLDDRAKRVVRPCEIRTGGQCHRNLNR